MPELSTSHLVLIPSYNPGPKVFETVTQALLYWGPVWVVIDGSEDGTDVGLSAMALEHPQLSIIQLDCNHGKGAAVLIGLARAREAGYSYVLCMDSDGQHPAHLIPRFMRASQDHPGAMILGIPVFDSHAPRARVYGRRLSNLFVNIETLGRCINDSLFGFRIYPIEALYRIMRKHRSMRGFDFDPEAAVRLCWEGVPAVNIEAPVRYFKTGEGGVSHFHYGRDNLLLTRMHLRLVFGLLLRLPRLLRRRRMTEKTRP